MYKNDRTRKEILVDFGFRLPSALDNRPLTFEEFEGHLNQVVYMSATPGPYELERSEQVVQQLIRPTGVVDPTIDVRQTDGQIDDLLEEIRIRVERGERSLVTTLTKKMAEDLADYLRELGVKVQYLHSEVDTLERVAILRDLRLGVFDVLVGINLLREGIDLPEVTLVAILDADKEGFLRSSWSLIQMIGRAARNIGGKVIMYADRTTESMAAAIEETNRRRGIQAAYNTEHGIEPTTIVKGIHDLNERLRVVAEGTVVYTSERQELAGRALTLENTAAIEKLVTRIEAEMRSATQELEFERAAALRKIQGSGCGSSSRTSRASASRGTRARRRSRRRGGSEAQRRRGRRRGRHIRGHERHGPAGRRGPAATSTWRNPSRRAARPPTGCRASATSTPTTTARAGRPAGSTAHVGSDGDAERPAPDGDAAAAPPPLIDLGAPCGVVTPAREPPVIAASAPGPGR
jgi:excinuclease ABC subunit B